MRRLLRWLGFALAGLLVLALCGAGWIWFASARTLGAVHVARAERLAQPTAAERAGADHQMRVLGCIACHGEGLSGRMALDVPGLALFWAPNLADLATRASDQQLAQAIRQGIGHDGRALFLMPSVQYSRLSDGQVAAMIAYIRAQPAAGAAVPPIQWGPIGRLAIATGGLLPMPARMEDYRVRQPWPAGPAEEAGRQLAATGCTDCHGPDLSGGQPTPDQAAPDLAIAAGYDLDQFRTLLRTGVPPGGRDLGMMREVALTDLHHYTDAEIAALHAYLRARAAR
jgi:mono/diheme cytochrome c family protein